ncbi:hypothetical protein GCM10009744_17850 [Kribbella alba]|uniref:Uncharacterized protein n=1 Tax=Kribbella alba TaxID=190197 RepID=A0ABN2F5S3_9ACTN
MPDVSSYHGIDIVGDGGELSQRYRPAGIPCSATEIRCRRIDSRCYHRQTLVPRVPSEKENEMRRVSVYAISPDRFDAPARTFEDPDDGHFGACRRR